ncbi:MAG: 5-formyltetrahydrofolate cyclo-ligase [Pseudomonadota bacterium]
MTEHIEHLRATHRASRAALSKATLDSNARGLWQNVEAITSYQQATTVAAYISIRGEIDVSGLIESGSASGKQFYLPVLQEDSMGFMAWTPGEPLVKKAFGLLEPDVSVSQAIDVRELDVVLTPLVVFDDQCNRIGQGGGFYDRTFAHRQMAKSGKPVLIGVAHESQRETRLTPQHWDIPLDVIATESHVYAQRTQ